MLNIYSSVWLIKNLLLQIFIEPIYIIAVLENFIARNIQPMILIWINDELRGNAIAF
jgi:hypothetical protein